MSARIAAPGIAVRALPVMADVGIGRRAIDEPKALPAGVASVTVRPTCDDERTRSGATGHRPIEEEV